MKGFVLFIALFLSTIAYAANAPQEEPSLLGTLREVRLKQQDEESLLRVVSQPFEIQSTSFCLPIEQARQRLRDLERSQKTFSGDVTVMAGHEEVTIEDNNGKIDNSINVQIINPDEERQCL